jgi:hypothetical protein
MSLLFETSQEAFLQAWLDFLFEPLLVQSGMCWASA